MIKSFKVNISVGLLMMMEENVIGKDAIQATGLSAFNLMRHFELDIPTLPDTPWTVSCSSKINIDPLKIDYVVNFLKYVWLYSKHQHDYGILFSKVARELTNLEVAIKYNVILQRNRRIAKEPRNKIKYLSSWIEEALMENSSISVKELFYSVPESSFQKNGEGIFRSEDRICCSNDPNKSIGKRAFYEQVKKLKEKIADN